MSDEIILSDGTRKITQDDLKQFYGTENYYKDMFGLILTDGTKFLMDALKCGWLMSDIAVINAMDEKVLADRNAGNNFLILTLKINAQDKTAQWNLKADTNEPILYAQKYDYTDISNYTDMDEIKFYLIDNVLLLEGEY